MSKRTLPFSMKDDTDSRESRHAFKALWAEYFSDCRAEDTFASYIEAKLIDLVKDLEAYEKAKR